MTNRYRLHGLYAVTELALASVAMVSKVEGCLQGGARVVQYRDKSDDRERRRTDAGALLQLCRRFQVPLIINDDVSLAAEIAADGVHLGSSDMGLRDARRRLGKQALIGVSCYNRIDRAIAAEYHGASYVAFGRFFPSTSKPQAAAADPALLRSARKALSLPIVAIGGITPQNGGALIRAGADMLAVIHALFGEPDTRRAAQAFSQLFSPEVVPR